jgi:hypothetical protein
MACRYRSHKLYRAHITYRGAGGALFGDIRYWVRLRARRYRVQWQAPLPGGGVNTTLWPAKYPAEALVAAFDFSADLQVGETIDSATVTVSLESGVDPSPASVLDGAPTIDAGTVLHAFSGGAPGARYELRCEVTLLPSDRILVLAATLPVRSA